MKPVLSADVAAAIAYGKGDKPANAASRIVATPERANAHECAGLRTMFDHDCRGAGTTTEATAGAA